MIGNDWNIKDIKRRLCQFKNREDFVRFVYALNHGIYGNFEGKVKLEKEIRTVSKGAPASAFSINIVLLTLLLIFGINIVLSFFITLGTFLYLKHLYTKEVKELLANIDTRWAEVAKKRNSQNLGIKKDNFRIDDFRKILGKDKLCNEA